MPVLKPPLLFAAGASLVASTAATGYTTATGSTQGWHRLPVPTPSWDPVTCVSDSKEYGKTTVDGMTLGRCCPISSACDFVTTCSDDVQTFIDGSTLACVPGASCQTMTIFQSEIGTSSALDIFCWEDWEISTIFRQKPVVATSTSSDPSTTLTPGPSITTSLASATATATTTGSSDSRSGTSSDSSASTGSGTDSESASDSPSTSPESDGASQAWIAGAVIGPVAGCAIIAALGFWLFRRRTRRVREATVSTEAAQVPPVAYFQQPTAAAPVEGGYVEKGDDDRVRSELPG